MELTFQWEIQLRKIYSKLGGKMCFRAKVKQERGILNTNRKEIVESTGKAKKVILILE